MNDISPSFDRSFTTGEAAAILSVAPAALQSWIHRGLIVGFRDKAPGVRGVRRKVSFSNLVEIAIASDLIEEGFNAATSFKAGAAVAHSGGGAVNCGEGQVRPGRSPGHMFPPPYATLIVFNNDQAIVVPFRASNPTHILKEAWDRLGLEATMSFYVANKAHRRVLAALEAWDKQ